MLRFYSSRGPSKIQVMLTTHLYFYRRGTLAYSSSATNQRRLADMAGILQEKQLKMVANKFQRYFYDRLSNIKGTFQEKFNGKSPIKISHWVFRFFLSITIIFDIDDLQYQHYSSLWFSSIHYQDETSLQKNYFRIKAQDSFLARLGLHFQ